MKENQISRYANGTRETLDFIKEGSEIDRLNEGTISLHVPWACRVIRLKKGAHTTGLKDTEADGSEDGYEPLEQCNESAVKQPNKSYTKFRAC